MSFPLLLIRNRYNNELIVEHIDDWLWQEGYRKVRELPRTPENEAMCEMDKYTHADMRFSN